MYQTLCFVLSMYSHLQRCYCFVFIKEESETQRAGPSLKVTQLLRTELGGDYGLFGSKTQTLSSLPLVPEPGQSRTKQFSLCSKIN